ncbi:mechanosensitive ion channel [Halomonas sp. 18H]|uniref:mechanosensitive ion channel domain-containing protein n=1 Tax=Halomonas almeriensis TaxID=308163 RepID=UPI002230863F|nr:MULTISPECIES: mechanosensitive ion channel domain-containing protein [Halomonas]MCW4151950.1 mechanosensitive ion channel [Halomonas sp. 18H]MDN3552392.1 mechanosensitive ion channel [Halomonas almeriensis]
MLLRWLLIALMAFAGPALAQSADPGASAPANATLADMLENPETRQQLIEQLRGMAEAPADSSEGQSSDDSSAPAVEEPSLPRQLAEMTSNIVGDIGKEAGLVYDSLAAVFVSTSDAAQIDIGMVLNATLNLGLVILATFALFLLIRRLGRPLFTRLSLWSLNGPALQPMLRLLICVALAALIDSLIVALAYVGGNLVATFVVGESGELTTRASLFLNAFLVIELLKAGVRMLFASRYEGLRLLPIAARDASYWNRWIARLIGLAGYGLMVVVPLANAYLSPRLGQSLGTLIMIGAFVYAIAVVLRNCQHLRDALQRQSKRSSLPITRVALSLLSRVWHLLAIAYFFTVLVLTLTQPEDALPFVLIATLQTLAAILVGLGISRLITQTIGRRISLSDDLRRKLPLLEVRLNGYVPKALKVIRTILLIAVVMISLNAWQVFDLAAWYASEAGRGLIAKLFSVIMILIIALVAWLMLASMIEHKLNPATGRGEPSSRTQTLLALFRNALAITLLTVTIMVVLAEIGINIGPLIAGAGVLGLAIGFGAQKLVQDIITGVFIQIENALNVGDVVTVGGVTGTAERLSIRSVALRDLSGTYHIVPFSSVDTVSNYMREFAFHVGEYGIAYRENIDEAIEALQTAFNDLSEDEEYKRELLEPLEVAGVIALADSSVNIRVRLKTTPGMQWAVGRAYNRLVKYRLDEAGIEIPFPHTTLYFGADKDGDAAPANLRIMQDDYTADGSPAGQPRAPEAPEPEDTTTRREVHNQDGDGGVDTPGGGGY